MELQNWQNMVNDVGNTFMLKTMDQEKLHDSKVARVIASIPYIAGCENPRQTAINHLGLYLTAHQNPVFDSGKTESIAQRMFDIKGFKGGRQTVIKKGLKILELLSLEDHNGDRQLDAGLGKNNPLNEGAIDYDTEKLRLMNEINAIECPELDHIMLDNQNYPDIWF